jgi:hypothetical protein
MTYCTYIKYNYSCISTDLIDGEAGEHIDHIMTWTYIWDLTGTTRKLTATSRDDDDQVRGFSTTRFG